MVRTVCRSRVELTAWLTAPRALRLFHGARQDVRPLLQLLKQAHVLDGDHRLVGERRDQLDLLVGEGLDFGPPDHDDANESALPEHGNSQDRAETSPCLDFRVFQFVFRVSHDVWDLHRPSLKGDPPDDSASSRTDWVPLKEILQFGGDVVSDRQLEQLTVQSEDESFVGTAQSRGVLDECFQNGLQIKRRPADDLENFAGRGLLLEGLTEFWCAPRPAVPNWRTTPGAGSPCG